MHVKLLTPQQNKTAVNEQQTRDIIRTQELAKAATSARLNLATAEADFNGMLAKHRAQWAREVEEHDRRLATMQGEVDALEAKRLNALIPVTILAQSAEDKLRESEEFIARLREREDNVEALTEKLEDRLDDVGAREVEVTAQSKTLAISKDNVARQLAAAEANAALLASARDEFLQQRAAIEAKLAAQNNALAAEEQRLGLLRDNLASTEKRLSEQAIRLADERGTLDRAWQEVERKRKAISP